MGRACHAGGGRHASQPGTAGGAAVVRVFALPPRSPASRVCSSGGAQPRSPSTPPACAGTQGPWSRASSPRRLAARLTPVCSPLRAQPPTPGPCVPAPARLSGCPPPAWHSLPRAHHGTPAHGVTALGSCACASRAHRRRQRRQLRPQRSRSDPQTAPVRSRVRLRRCRLLDRPEAHLAVRRRRVV